MCLEIFANQSLTTTMLKSKVSSFVDIVGNWDVSILKEMLLMDVVKMIMATRALANDLGPNLMVWKTNKDKNFSIKSAYDFLTKHGNG